MATRNAIAATSQAILRLIREACPDSEFPGVEFLLYQATDFRQPAIGEGLTVHLYRIGMSGMRQSSPSGFVRDGTHRRAPLPLDLFYVLSAWGKSVPAQQRLLASAIRGLEDTPILSASILNGDSQGSETFRPEETVELVWDPLSLQDLSRLWEVLRPNPPLSVTYVARVVALESDIPPAEG